MINITDLSKQSWMGRLPRIKSKKSLAIGLKRAVGASSSRPESPLTLDLNLVDNSTALPTVQFESEDIETSIQFDKSQTSQSNLPAFVALREEVSTAPTEYSVELIDDVEHLFKL